MKSAGKRFPALAEMIGRIEGFAASHSPLRPRPNCGT
jgi:hypothetical protein